MIRVYLTKRRKKTKTCLIPGCTGQRQVDSPHCSTHQPPLPLFGAVAFKRSAQNADEARPKKRVG